MTAAGRVERHLAASLGPPSLITDARDPATGRVAGFRVATFEEQPVEAAFTLITIGLCEPLGHELTVCAWNAFRDDALHNLIFAIGHYLAESNTPAAPGTVYELPGPFVSRREWRHVLAFFPLYHEDQLTPVDNVQFVWLIPITEEESAFIDANGPQAFDSLLEERDPDLLDMNRDSVV